MISSLRINGLASGMDTESIVKDLMKAQRAPVTKLQQNKQILEWQQEEYRAINTALRTFRDSVLNMKLQSTYLAKAAVSNNESIVTATAASNAVAGSYTVNVISLASGVSVASTASLTGENYGTSNNTLKEQFTTLPDTLTFSIQDSQGNVKDFSFNTAEKTIYDVVNGINSADLGITASYDSEQNRFFLSTKSTGASAKFTVLNDTSSFLSDASGAGTGILKLKIKTGAESTGQDAVINFGDAANLTSSTNEIKVNGITIKLKQIGATTISVNNNTDAVFDTIVKFIDSYNSLSETIGNKLYEKRYKDYLPLTDEQREQMTDDQIEKWTEKARSGLLRNDTILSSLFSKMRMSMSAVVPGVSGGYEKDGKMVYSDRLSQIGIKTTEDYMSAKLVVDEDKLREAIQKDPTGVMELFTKKPVSEDYDEMGIAMRLYEDVNAGMKSLMDKAGAQNEFNLVDDSFIGKQRKEIDKRIAAMEDRLQQVEDRYWRQFNAMEQAMQKMNSQSMWLMQQFGGGQQ